MFSFYKRFWPYYLFEIALLYFATVRSFIDGEELYYLIPLLIVPLWVIQSYFIYPIEFRLRKPYTSLKGVEISQIKTMLSFWCMLEIGFSLGLFIFGFLHGVIARITIIYFVCGMITLSCFLYCLWRVFKFQAKRQGIDVGSLKAGSLFSELCSEVFIDYMKSTDAVSSDQ